MTQSIRIVTSALMAVAAVSCSPQADQYDTPNAVPAPAAAATTTTPTAAATAGNPVYDSQAAYEDHSSVTQVDPGVAPEPPAHAASPAAPHPSAAASVPANGAAIIHTVVKGDTLSGISSKYKVPVASIKQANRMTNDTVVLGRKMVIPPR